MPHYRYLKGMLDSGQLTAQAFEAIMAGNALRLLGS